jgi:tetratricopeptide (TPR) repeat protein
MKLRDPLTEPGWQHFYNNEYDQALTAFEREAREHPGDPEAYNHIAQAVLYREMFRNGALESQLVTGTNPFLRRAKMDVSPDVRKLFQDALGKAIDLGNAELKQDANSIPALYALSVAHGLRANYAFLVEKAWSQALHDATTSRKYSDRIVTLDPKFVDAYLVLGLHDYVVGSLPLYLRMVGFLAGFHGNRELGIRELQDVAQHGLLNRYDAQILLAAIYRRERQPELAIPLLKECIIRFPRNYLLRLEEVQMYSDAGDKTAALQVLDDVGRLQAKGAPGYRNLPVEKIAYLRGNLLFWYRDFDPALVDMKQATLNVTALDLGTAVLAWLRLGQLYDLKGEHAQAVAAYKETMKTAPESAAAKEAKSYISSPYQWKRPDG